MTKYLPFLKVNVRNGIISGDAILNYFESFKIRILEITLLLKLE